MVTVSTAAYRRFLPAALLLLAGAFTHPAAAQQAAMEKVQSFTENGIRVILSPADNQLVSVIVGLEGGLLSGETTNPGLGEFTSDLITSSGSEKYTKDELRTFLSRTSTTITGNGDYKGIGFTMTATRPNFDKAWSVLSSLIREPIYDPTEYRNIMQYSLARVKRRHSSPDDQAYIAADSLIKLGHPVLSRWTRQEDLHEITIDMIRDFHKSVAERTRMLVVIVGNVSADEVKSKLAEFSAFPEGSFKPVRMKSVEPRNAPGVEVIDRGESPTTYVYGAFTGPRSGEPDYWPLAVGMSHLRNVLFEEIRTKRNLSYAPGAFLTSTMGQGIGMLSVSSVYPDSSITIMKNELEKMREGEFPAEEMENSKQVYITGYFMRQMTNGSKANLLYSAERNAGDWKQAFSYDAIQAVDKDAVQEAFEKYARNLQFGIAGRKEGVTRNEYVVP